MITDSDSDTADLLKFLEQRVSRLESEREPEGSVNQVRTVDEQEASSDSVSATTSASDGWTWGQSSWGFSSW